MIMQILALIIYLLEKLHDENLGNSPDRIGIPSFLAWI